MKTLLIRYRFTAGTGLLFLALATLSACGDRHGPDEGLGVRPYLSEESTVSGSGQVVATFYSGGTQVVEDDASWSFSYPLSNGFAVRGFVPSVPTGLTDQQLEDTLPFYRPSSASIVAGTNSSYLIPQETTRIFEFADSAGVPHRLELTSEQVTPHPILCDGDGCPMSAIRIYKADTLVADMKLHWQTIGAAYELSKSVGRIYRAGPTSTILEMSAPVSSNMLAAVSNANEPMTRVAQFAVDIGLEVGASATALLLPALAHAQGGGVCAAEAATATAAVAKARQEITEAAAYGFINRRQNVEAMIASFVALGAIEAFSRCVESQID